MLKKKMVRCNLLLLIISALTIASSIVLEVMDFSLPIVWIHTIVALLWSVFIFQHIVLHWGGIGNWLGEIKRLKLKMTRAITWLFFLVFLSGILATIEVCLNKEHTMAGGIHGKFAMIMIVLMVIHIIKHRKWYNERKTGAHFTPHIDNEKCVQCKRCVKECPANVLSSDNGRVTVLASEYCFACKKCVAICSEEAIS